jgi:hypothetical protein
MSGFCPLSLRERAGVREAAQTFLSRLRSDGEQPLPATALAASLTPALSRREREQVLPLRHPHPCTVEAP